MVEHPLDNGRAARILVVDDERHIARLIEFLLMKEGYNVKIAHCGEDALKWVPEFQPDAVVLDLIMPGMSGIDVLRKIRADERHADTKVIVLSARSFEDRAAEVIESGANLYCTKPVAPTTLMKRLIDCGVPPTLAQVAG